MSTISFNGNTVAVAHITHLGEVHNRMGSSPPVSELQVNLTGRGYLIAYGTNSDVTTLRASIVTAIDALSA